MKVLKHFIIVVLILALSVPASLASQQQEPDPVDELARDIGESLKEELVMEKIDQIAGPSCQLYSLGIDLVNFIYNGQWTFLEPALEVSALFRNQPWREIIWQINDQREAFVKELTVLRRQQCLLAFQKPRAETDADPSKEKKRSELAFQLDLQIAELEQKLEYYASQRYNMMFERPLFGDGTQFDGESFALPELETDKIFYWLFKPRIDVDWDQFKRDKKRLTTRVAEGWQAVIGNIPDDCFAIVKFDQELELYFANKFSYSDGRYRDEEGNTYKSFADFVSSNGQDIVDEYTEKHCKPTKDRVGAENEQSSSEEQFEAFLAGLNAVLDVLSDRLKEIEQALSQLQRQKGTEDGLTEDEEEQEQLLITRRGRYLAMIDYYMLVLNNVGSSASQSLQVLGDRIARFAEAIMGVVQDDAGRKKFRISFAERFQKRKEASLTRICGRLEKMYRESGRSTDNMPVIGSVNGFTYCRAKPECEGVDLTNFVGGSEGRRKLAECSGFLFDSAELGPTQDQQRRIDETSEDISEILDQRSTNDLLKMRSFHYSSLRNRYQAMYGSQGDTTQMLEDILNDTTLDLHNDKADEVYDPDGDKQHTHYNLLRKIYQDFREFTEAQEGSCPAPKVPKD